MIKIYRYTSTCLPWRLKNTVYVITIPICGRKIRFEFTKKLENYWIWFERVQKGKE